MIVSMNDSVSQRAIREELSKLLNSEIFARSGRLSRFLQFTVEQVLAGKRDRLKEYVIGVEVYDRCSPYHPAIDSIVRSEARRLRIKLKQYYESHGKMDPVRISYRLGSYAPVFYRQEIQGDPSSNATEPNGLSASASGEVVIRVERFVDLSDTPQATICARGVTAELMHLLIEVKGCKIAPSEFGSSQSAQAHLRLTGDIRQHRDCLRIIWGLVTAEGFRFTSQRFDIPAEAADSFDLQERIAAELVSQTAAIAKWMTAGSCLSMLPRARTIPMVGKPTETAYASS
jgi:TolB-like protein